MGVDLRVGKTDHYTRYRVYPPNVDRTDAVAMKTLLIGILHGKDVSKYSKSFDTISGKWARTNIRATIETTDRIFVKPDYFLYDCSAKVWYIVDATDEESVNTSQQNSTRPIIVQTITIRKAN